jgi:hypothetical protein
MKAPIFVLAVLMGIATVAVAEDEPSGNCPPGQIEKAFHDGASVSYQCLDAAAPGMVDDTHVQYGGEGDENGSGGAEPPEE